MTSQNPIRFSFVMCEANCGLEVWIKQSGLHSLDYTVWTTQSGLHGTRHIMLVIAVWPEQCRRQPDGAGLQAGGE